MHKVLKLKKGKYVYDSKKKCFKPQTIAVNLWGFIH